MQPRSPIPVSPTRPSLTPLPRITPDCADAFWHLFAQRGRAAAAEGVGIFGRDMVRLLEFRIPMPCSTEEYRRGQVNLSPVLFHFPLPCPPRPDAHPLPRIWRHMRCAHLTGQHLTTLVCGSAVHVPETGGRDDKGGVRVRVLRERTVRSRHQGRRSCPNRTYVDLSRLP